MTFNNVIFDLINKELKTRAEVAAIRGALAKKQWWKVLDKRDDGKYYASHGGDMEYPVPTSGHEGVLVKFTGSMVQTCRSGLHITAEPSYWIGDGNGNTLHPVEVDWLNPDLRIGEYEESGKKIAVSALEIFAEANKAECEAAGVAYRKDFVCDLTGRNQCVTLQGLANASGDSFTERGSVDVKDRAHLQSAQDCDVWLGEAASAVLEGNAVVTGLGNLASVVARGDNNSIVVDATVTTLALYGTSVAHIHVSNGACIYATDASTVIFHGDPKYVKCLILRKNARAFRSTGKVVPPINQDKYKVVRLKNGMRRIELK